MRHHGGFMLGLGLGLRNVQSFNPASLFAGTQGWWYDPSDLSSMWQDSAGTTPAAVGNPVGLVHDKSGNGNHLAQATSSKRPILNLANGLYYLTFDGVDDFLASAATINLSSATALGVCYAFTPTGTSKGLLAEFGPNINTTPKTFYLGINDNATGKISISITGNTVVTNTNGIISNSSSLGSGVTSLASVQSMDITQSSVLTGIPMRRNGAPLAVSPATAAGVGGTSYSTQTLYVGARAGTSGFAAVDLYGIILRATPFTATELGHVEHWLGGKAGLAI